MEDFIEGMLTDIFVGPGDSTAFNFVKILTLNLADTSSEDMSSYAYLWNTCSAVYNVVAKIGLTFLTLFFLMELVERATDRNFDLEVVVRMLLKLLVGYLLIQYGLTLFEWIVKFAANFAGAVQNAAIEGSGGEIGLTDQISSYVNGLGFWKKLTAILKYIVPWLFTLIANGAIWVQCWSHNIRLLVQVMIAPIALADMFEEGRRAQGFRYIRSTLAVALEGAVMVVIVIACSGITVNYLDVDENGQILFDSMNMFGLVLTIGVKFLEITMIASAGSIAREVVGN